MEKTVTIPTSLALAPGRNPMFPEKRVCHGRSGNVYPIPFPGRMLDEKRGMAECEDGGKIAWLSEHGPMNRMKGMVGICMRPGKRLVETRVWA